MADRARARARLLLRLLADARRLARRFFDEHWIDAPPGPASGAGRSAPTPCRRFTPTSCSTSPARRRDVLVLAHELGHGVHAALAAPQGIFQQSTPLTLAETASVFGEALTFARPARALADPGGAARAARRGHRGSDRDGVPPGRDEPLRGRWSTRAGARRASCRSSASASCGRDPDGPARRRRRGHRRLPLLVVLHPPLHQHAGLRLRLRLRPAARVLGLPALPRGGRRASRSATSSCWRAAARAAPRSSARSSASTSATRGSGIAASTSRAPPRGRRGGRRRERRGARRGPRELSSSWEMVRRGIIGACIAVLALAATRGAGAATKALKAQLGAAQRDADAAADAHAEGEHERLDHGRRDGRRQARPARDGPLRVPLRRARSSRPSTSKNNKHFSFNGQLPRQPRVPTERRRRAADRAIRREGRGAHRALRLGDQHQAVTGPAGAGRPSRARRSPLRRDRRAARRDARRRRPARCSRSRGVGLREEHAAEPDRRARAADERARADRRDRALARAARTAPPPRARRVRLPAAPPARQPDGAGERRGRADRRRR